MLSLTVKKLDAFKFDGVAESDNTGVKGWSQGGGGNTSSLIPGESYHGYVSGESVVYIFKTGIIGFWINNGLHRVMQP